VNQAKPFNVIGRAHERRDGLGHVTGTTVYVDDISFPRMGHLKMVRNPLVHARIRGIDFSEAEKVPGFVTALTARDVPKNVYTILCLIGVEPDDEPVLAEDRVRYRGEQIAAVVAETEAAAAEAAAKVRLDLEELPHVLDVEEALAPGAPVVTHWGTNHFVYEGHPFRRLRYGDAEAAREQADHVVSGRYQLSPIEHAPVETTGCVAKPEADGRVTVYTNTQAIYFSLDNTAFILGVPPHQLHFVGGTVGGGFGGKVDVIVEPIAALAAMRTGRPVKYVYTRPEEMQVSSTRSAARIYIRDGVTADGTIVSREVTTFHDAGAYSRHSPYGCTKHAANAAGPYTIPNVSVDVHCVYTNRQPSSAMRGFGVTEASFAVEMQMDRVARELGLDPWELRLRHAYRNGDERPYRKTTEDASLVEAIQAAATLAGVELSPELQAMTSDDGNGGRR
jgi:CO/xanthine dehydrogenase Mo-binding subunit